MHFLALTLLDRGGVMSATAAPYINQHGGNACDEPTCSRKQVWSVRTARQERNPADHRRTHPITGDSARSSIAGTRRRDGKDRSDVLEKMN